MFEIRPARPEEIDAAIEIVREVFEEFVRPDLGAGGWDQLLKYVNGDAARDRLASDHLMFVAEQDGGIIGVLEVRQASHISLLVVAPDWFGKGVARELMRKGVETCLGANPALDRITVHASRYAVEVYRRLGFEAIGGELEMDGIRFTPMARSLK